jgi:hypothetical protein
MTDSRPVDGRHPTVPDWIVVHYPFHAQFVRLALIVGVVTVEGEGQAIVQLEPVLRQILPGPCTG